MKYLATVAIAICALFSNAQNWDLLTPIKTNDIVRNCSFYDENNGYAVIQVDGQILKTTDGGLTWERPWTPGISANLYDIEMVSLDTIFSCGVNGEIFRSIDSGNSWIEMSTPTAQWLYALEFLNSSLGFASGHGGTILKTIDGGSTWELRETNTSNRLMDIEFVNENVGYACGWNGEVVKTIDGGETWTNLDTGHDGSFFNCHFPSENIGYACGFSQSILKTDDGGETWTLQNEGSNTLNYIEFIDNNNGWAVGDWGMHYITSDGGQNWTVENTTGDSFLWCGQYLDENTSFLMGKDVMFKSADNTENWEILKISVPKAKYNGLFFLDDNTGYAAGSEGGFAENSDDAGIIYTEDGGLTWDVQHFAFTSGWWDIHFSSLTHGIAVGESQIAKTTDGGENWDISNLPMEIISTATYQFSENEWLVGGSGLFGDICKTSNNGSNYDCIDNLAATDFYFVDENIGYAVADGSSENIYKTDDAGETWQYIPTGSFAGKHSVYFMNENLGWVGLSNGGILKTTDGGDTWTTSFANNTIVGIHFYDEMIGFCVSSDGQIFNSNDGGASWELFLSGIDFTMPVAVEGYFTENYVYLGTWGGDVYRCELGCGSFSAGTIVGDNEWCEGTIGNIFISDFENYESFEWTLPDGWTTEESDGIIEVIAGTEGGIIEVTVTNVCGISASSEKEVNIIPEVSAIEGVSTLGSICTNSTFEILVDNAQEGVEYYWETSENWIGEASTSELSLTVDGDDGWISVFAENECGTSESYVEEITLSQTPDVSFDLPSEFYCSNVVVNLDQGLPAGGSYFGEGVLDNQIDLSSLEDSEIEITYVYNDLNGCSSSATDILTVIESAITGGELLGETEFCPGSELLFTLNGIEGAESFDWIFPTDWEVNSMENTLEVISATTSGIVEVTASNSCETEAVFELESNALNAAETPTLISNEESWCVGELGTVEISLNNEEILAIGNTTLDYSVEFFETDYTIDFFGEPGVYSVGIATSNNCGTSDSLFINLEVFSLPEVSLAFEYDAFCTEEIYFATVEPAGGSLTGLGVNDLSIETFFLNPDEVYEYEYTYVDENGCENSAGVELIFEICTSIGENSQNLIQLYPNPVNQILTLELKDQKGQFYEIYDFTGRLITSNIILNDISQLDVSDWSVGMYVFKCGIWTQQFEVVK